MRISDWSSDVCSSDLCQSSQPACEKERGRERYNMKNRIKIGLMLGTAGALGWTPAYAQAPAEAQIAPALPQAVAPAQAESTDPASNVGIGRSEEHTSELQSLMRISYAVFCLKTKNHTQRLLQQST